MERAMRRQPDPQPRSPAYMYGIPGEGQLDLLAHLARGAGHFVAAHQAWAAGYMALGDAWSRGRSGICIAGRGTLAAELLRPACDAARAFLPLVICVAAQDPAAGRAPRAVRHGPRQDATWIGALARAVKECLTVEPADGAAEALQRAAEVAAAYPPGPVLLVRGNLRGACRPTAPAAAHRHPPDADADALERRLRSAHRPLAVAGASLRRIPGGPQSLARFARAWGMPVSPTLSALGLLDAQESPPHPACGLQARDRRLTGWSRSDLLVTIGLQPREVPPAWLRPSPRRAVIHFLPDGMPHPRGRAARSRIPSEREIVWRGEVARILDELASRGTAPDPASAGIVPSEPGTPSDLRRSHEQRRFVRLRRKVARGCFPPSPVEVFDSLAPRLSQEDLIICDAGLGRLWAGRFLDSSARAAVWIPSPGFAPGWALPAAIGAQLARGSGRAVVITGDAALLASAAELETARRQGVAVAAIVLRNSGWGWIRYLQERAYGRGTFADFRAPNMIRLARLYGAGGFRLERGDALGTILDEALSLATPAVIDIPADLRATDEILQAWGDPCEPL